MTLPPWGVALLVPYQRPKLLLWERIGLRKIQVVEGPIVAVAAKRYRGAMNLLLLVFVLLLLFGGGGFYFGGPVIGGGGLGLVLVICLIIYFLGGFRSKAE
jgi:hypothetical protein